MTMGYTRCTSVCPAIVEEMKAVERELGARARDVLFVLVSLDPVSDSPEALMRFARDHHLDPARWRLLTARDGDAVRDFAAVLGVKYAPASGEIAHSATIVAVDRRGVVRHRQTGVGENRRALLDAVR
jgi:protein SCO1/2